MKRIYIPKTAAQHGFEQTKQRLCLIGKPGLFGLSLLAFFANSRRNVWQAPARDLTASSATTLLSVSGSPRRSAVY